MINKSTEYIHIVVFTYIEEVFMTPAKTAVSGIIADNSRDDVWRLQIKF